MPAPDVPTAVKVGGSLFDHPNLGPGLRRWLDGVTGQVLLVPGGGAAAEFVRELDRLHRLGEEHAHWVALRAMTLTARFLGALVAAPVVEGFRIPATVRVRSEERRVGKGCRSRWSQE